MCVCVCVRCFCVCVCIDKNLTIIQIYELCSVSTCFWCCSCFCWSPAYRNICVYLCRHYIIVYVCVCVYICIVKLASFALGTGSVAHLYALAHVLVCLSVYVCLCVCSCVCDILRSYIGYTISYKYIYNSPCCSLYTSLL